MQLIKASLIAIALTLPVQAEEMDKSAEARQIVKQFMMQLKGELKKAMQSGGPVNAIAVCNEKAPQIAQSVSKSSGWQVGRTSLKLRNPANQPNDWQKAVLESFEQRKQAGENPKMMEFSEVVESDEGMVFRYMKAIPTGKVCLTCHGEKVSPDVEAKLKELYPQDQARGFNVGDIRGAFVLEKVF